MEFVPLSPALADAIATWVHSAHETMTFAGPTLAWPLTGADMVRVAAHEQRTAWVLLDAESPVALGTLRPQGDTARIGWILTDPVRRGQGWGRAMMTHLLQQASTMPGLDRVDLRVFVDNAAAYALYASLGFRDTGDLRSHLLDGRERFTTGMELTPPRR